MRNLTEEQRANMTKWVEALESGKYKQCTKRLCRVGEDGENTYCCLGVACEILHGPDSWEPAGHTPLRIRRSKTGDTTRLTLADFAQLGLTEDDEGELITMNDSQNRSFTDIAKYLRTTFLETK